MFTVYVIKSESTNKIYIGQTKKLEERILRHNKIKPNKAKSYTYKNIGPWILVYKEVFNTRKEAVKREKELKSYKGREYLGVILGL